jgi:5'(3')-deoxyribonucleotidase
MTRVLLDVDGVLCNFASAFLDIVNHTLGRLHVLSDVTEFSFAHSLGLSPDEADACYRAIHAGWCRALKPYPGAKAGVAALADVYVVTSPFPGIPTWSSEREAWLAEHFSIPSKRVVHTSAKYICAGDFLVDDRTDHLVAWSVEHPRGTAVLWSTPHNRREKWSGLETSSWEELAEWINIHGQRPEQGTRVSEPSKGPAGEIPTGNARAAGK